MNSAATLDQRTVASHPPSTLSPLPYSSRNERKLLKAFVLACLHKLFLDQFQCKDISHNHSLMECYAMDNKIIQLLITGIVDSGNYTLEGIAHYTHIPFDIIYDAACGISNQISITPWSRVIDLYIQVNPDTTGILLDKLRGMIEHSQNALSGLLNEKL